MTGDNIPKKCFAGVTVNEGPDFKLEVQEVDVPEPGKHMHVSKDQVRKIVC